MLCGGTKHISVVYVIAEPVGLKKGKKTLIFFTAFSFNCLGGKNPSFFSLHPKIHLLHMGLVKLHSSLPVLSTMVVVVVVVGFVESFSFNFK